jgi:8-oxo-dGTP pyrophosphatase MutT (NUDIX family)
MEVLEAATNPFRGVVPKAAGLPDDPKEFRQTLRRSLEAWKAQGLLVVWLEVPITKAVLIPVAVEEGFTFHHSNDDYLMMTYQLVEGAFIPPFATHYIGAGGVVLNPRRELLVVCERYRRPGQAPFYKLPGGALQPGEHLADAVIREVLEETGVKTEFDALVCFRHWHGYRYGKSDIYFVCRLKPLSRDIAIQEEEIEECLWLPVEDFLNSEDISAFNKHIVKAALDSPGISPANIEGFEDGTREFFMPWR